MGKKYVLITGSSSGMGEELALQLSTSYNVIINGRNEERLSSVLNRCSEGNHLIWQYDLEHLENLEQTLKCLIQDYGIKISYFIHCAGYMQMFPVKMLSHELFTATYNVNVISAGLIIKVLTSKKANNKSLESVVLISSNISNFGAKALSVYGSSKAALDGLMRSLAMELAPSVRINSVLPGGVKTAMTAFIYEDENIIKRMESTYPLGLGTVADIASAVRFLLSDEARWITGQQLTVDGGRTINITG